jgi:hypothetical protein
MMDNNAITRPPQSSLLMLRRRVLGLVALGFSGTAVELLLLAHDEEVNQWIPFVAIGLALAAIAWWVLSRAQAAVRAVQGAMLVVMITGGTGVVLHYRANMEFQLESDRSLSGFALMMKVLQAKAPPALAPGNMALLALIGLAGVSGVSRESSGG